MSLLLNLAVAATTLFAVVLVVLAVAGWRRTRRPKTALLALGFGWFAAAGILTSWWIFTREDLETLLTLHVTLTGFGLLTIYIASVKR